MRDTKDFPTSDLGRRARELVRRRPVTLRLPAEGEPPVTVRDVARRMDAERVSSVLLVEDGELPVGIITDRDLRSRVLAHGLGADTPARRIMTAPVECLDAAIPGAEALLQLLRSGRHHLVLEDGGRLVGVVTYSDLLRGHLQSPAALLESIAAASSAGDLADYADRVAATVETLHRSGVEATDVGRVVAALNDALASRLLVQAESELEPASGPPPCAWAWIVLGSEGRQEQSFLTDQDNALIYEDDSEEGRAYFAALAGRVVDGLLAAGFPPCPGGYMATSWCLPRDRWVRRFAAWIEQPEPESLMRAMNFFDWRRVAGGLDLEPLEDVVRRAAGNRLFVAQLARASMRKRPPLGLFRRIVADGGHVDLKSGALMPVSGLARLFAVEALERGGSTLRRLERAAAAGVVSEDGAEVLAEAFRFAFALRLRTQLADRRGGRPISNLVVLDRLSAGERSQLRQSFVAIDRLQKVTGQRLGTSQLG
jgi:CBS domain-containing protein